VIFLATLALAGTFASAQTVYRCGNSYGTQPCDAGTALDVTDHSTPADAARATRRTADDMKRAEAMEKARLAQEKNAPKAIVIGPKEPPKADPREHDKAAKDKKKKGKTEDPNVFTATAPREPKK
jgi:hypothetical protein